MLLYQQTDGVVLRAPQESPHWPCEMYVGEGRWEPSFDAWWLFFSRAIPASGAEISQLMDAADKTAIDRKAGNDK